MAKGIYVGVDSNVTVEEEKIIEFISNPAPTSWKNSSNGKTATASNEYGDWVATASGVDSGISFPVSGAFDAFDNVPWAAGELTKDGNAWVQLDFPSGIKIKPTKIEISYNRWGNSGSIQGFNPETNSWVRLTGTQYSDSTSSYTFTITTDTYITAIRAITNGYTSTKYPNMYYFRITEGAIKTTTQVSVLKGVARKVKKIYAGVEGVARKVKKGYIGVGGVARPFFSAEQKLVYYGTTTSLSVARNQLAATHVGNYALFAGGYTGSNSNAVDAYNLNLTRQTATMNNSTRLLAATTVGDYALFGGGYYRSSVVTSYTSALAKGTPAALSEGRSNLAATSIGNYALFAGGSSSSGNSTIVDSYTSTLTKGTPTKLSEGRINLAATHIGNYALFAGGGDTNTTRSAIVDTYTSTLAKGTATSLSVARYDAAATSVGNYALFAGGCNAGGYATVDTYTSSLVKGTATDLTYTRYSKAAATTVGSYALFGGGEQKSGTRLNSVDVYDMNLVKSETNPLSEYKYALAATTVGNCALFGGGHNGNGYSATVDVYQII